MVIKVFNLFSAFLFVLLEGILKMAFKPETVTTKVDQLMDLVRERKELSFDEVSKELGVSFQIIEAWASFLEEEGLLSVRYKLTTPYLVFEGEKIPAKPVEPELDLADVSFDSAYDAIAKGDFELAEKVYKSLVSRYHSIPQDKGELRREMEQALVKLDKDLNVKRGQSLQFSIVDGSKRVVELARASRDCLAKNDFGAAEERYNSAKDVFEGLPKGFDAEKARLEHLLVGLFKEIVEKKEKTLSRNLGVLSQEIERALPYFRQYVADGKLDDAVALYRQIKKVYCAIPDDFEEEKMKLQEQILAVYDELSVKLRQKLLSEMQEKSSQISALLDGMLGKLRLGQFDSARDDYERVRVLYDALPAGFLREKTALQNRIVRAYDEMVSRSGKVRETSLRERTEHINKLLRQVELCLNDKRFSSARDAYGEVLSLYSSLPGSAEKSALHYKIASLRGRFIEENAELEKVSPEEDSGENVEDVKVKIRALKSVAAPVVKQVVSG